MEGFSFTSIQPFSAIIGATITAATTLVIAVLITRKRKRVTFLISESEDLTLPLWDHGFVSLKVGNFTISKLNRARVFIKNTGNDVIRNFLFDIVIPGNHPMHLAEKRAKQNKLYEAIKIEDEPATVRGPTFHISVNFFNPKEVFEVIVFFEAETVDCQVECRGKVTRTKPVSRDPLKDLLDDMRLTSIQRQFR
jgi:hypothetical protein